MNGMRFMNRHGLSGGLLLKAVLVLLTPLSAWAGGAGTTSAQFLKMGVGARSLGMAGAYVAVADDAHALYWNPAGAAQAERPQIASSYNILYQDTSQGYLSYIHPTSVGVWGLGLNYLQVADIEKRAGDTAAADSTFSSKDSAYSVSYTRPRVWKDLSLGFTLKALQLKLDTKSASAFAVDLGAHYRREDSPLSLGVSVLNLGSSVKYDTVSDPLPLGVKVGAAYRFFNNRLLAAAGADSWVQEGINSAQLGVEWRPVSLFALRTGYQYAPSRTELGGTVGFSAGVGFHVRKLDIDYAYVPFGDLGDTNRLSLSFTF